MQRLMIKSDRVRENTSKEQNLMIDQEIFENVKNYSKESIDEISKRIEKLDREWDVERVLGVNMSTLALTGLFLAKRNRKWLALPSVVLGFFMQHSIQGWCPPLKLLRFLKFRTRNEIDQEKHALKALRGDYSNIKSAEQAYMAVKK